MTEQERELHTVNKKAAIKKINRKNMTEQERQFHTANKKKVANKKI